MAKQIDNLMERVVALCKRRGFIYPGSEIYGGLANSWDFGPLGVELKNNIKNLWWRRFVQLRDDIVGLDAAIILNPKVWEASGHLANFSDPLVECKICHLRLKEDQYDEIELHKTTHGGKVDWTKPEMFNLMFKTFIGAKEDSSSVAYLRPETAQAIFVDFKNIVDTNRVKIPFGVAQIGKAFRNEITPGNFIFRVRELEQMEIEYFFAPPKDESEWQEKFELWRQEMWSWMTEDLGISKENIHELEVEEGERAHYSKKTVDFEYDFPFGKKELYGLAYRADFDLKSHGLNYKDLETGRDYIPHVIEPSMGVERSILAVLLESYREVDGRVFMKFPLKLAPFKAAVFPLLPNKPELVEKARKIYLDLKVDLMVSWDERGNIGKRYAAQDEVGTPFCITVDFQTLEDEMVTVRDRDTATQDRVKISELKKYVCDRITGSTNSSDKVHQ